ncbi:MAG: catalase [Tepidiformaceae bacterium]
MAARTNRSTRPTPDSAGSAPDEVVEAPDAKLAALEPFRKHPEDHVLTTDQGVKIPNTDDSLRVGTRGPSLLEDFHLREKITRFDHERIPERVVHARGSAAHGFFQPYRSLAEYTSAAFLQDPNVQTPVFVRFSTVVGSRGSADTVRDVRGFATKFYTSAGNFDLVGNNIPVFFIQDGIKFPDIVHAVKPEADSEMPGASSAHDTFWDFVSLAPETAHMVMWVMSDRAIPRSYRTMDGFGVHTFRLVNAEGKTRLVKFHWRPVAGLHSLVWDEAQKLAGQDPDFHRRDLWESIENGAFPEYELGLQIVEEEDAESFGFDLLDATKLIPEELVPVEIVGRMVLNRNPDNFFAETEQVAFHIGNLVPGIDVTNDPLLQARLFSYLDTQLTRLGGPNFHEIPINQALAPVHNHQQDGLHRDTIPTGKANYEPNSIGNGCPVLAPLDEGYVHVPEPVMGSKTRERSPTFRDFFSQATLFYRSLTVVEQQHITAALCFEISKVQRPDIRERAVNELLANIDGDLARAVAGAVGVESVQRRDARGASAPGNPGVEVAPSLSMELRPKTSIRGAQVAVLLEDGFSAKDVTAVLKALDAEGAKGVIVARALGSVQSDGTLVIEAEKALASTPSTLFDAVFLPNSNTQALMVPGAPALQFIREAFGHYKTVAATGEARALVSRAIDQVAPSMPPDGTGVSAGVVLGDGADGAFVGAFVASLTERRHWQRDASQQMGMALRL